jgi:hypothetical protein
MSSPQRLGASRSHLGKGLSVERERGGVGETTEDGAEWVSVCDREGILNSQLSIAVSSQTIIHFPGGVKRVLQKETVSGRFRMTT